MSLAGCLWLSSGIAWHWRWSVASRRRLAAAQFGVSRQTLHTSLSRYRRDGLAGLLDRSHRPDSCPHQASAEVEVPLADGTEAKVVTGVDDHSGSA
ncbi:helix-turn-helix domain-containing protein [Amycolatopsis thermophila]|uniref:Insertion element IS150 protein InsJ-like helix-turn-helix domain-containing protein n=1 Tax=Amycolatopsis thermophila TaxID=206084 RepID=A0ABU0ESK7_9PSEU|nr:leucine zipper domain-containing protein [Amycolatopsis thermophila]MDQ0378288.1 hypothetical protein [Amycolatopsis thermophila]